MAFELGAVIKINALVAGMQSVNQLNAGVKAIGENAKGSVAGSTALSESVTKMGSIGSSAVSSFASKFATLLTPIAAVTAAFQGMQAIISKGFEANAGIESARIGIASLITSQAQLHDAQGNLLMGNNALNAAMGFADEQMTKLRVAGLNTAATFDQLSQAYQQAVGAGLSAGLNLDQVRQITVGITQAAGALGVPMNQLNQEVVSILAGTIDMNSRVAKSLQITNEDVKLWKEKGTLADNLNQKMAVFATAGSLANGTWTVMKSNMEEAFAVLSGSVTSGMFDKIKGSVNQAMAGIFDLKTAKISTEFAGLSDVMTRSFTSIGEAFATGIDTVSAGVQKLSQWLTDNRQTVGEIGLSFTNTVAVIWEAVSAVGSLIAVTADAAVTVGLVEFAFKAINQAVAAVSDGVTMIGAMVVMVGAKLLDYIAVPLSKIIELAGRASNFISAGSGDALVAQYAAVQGAASNAHQYYATVINDFAVGNNALARTTQHWKDVGVAAESAKNKTNAGVTLGTAGGTQAIDSYTQNYTDKYKSKAEKVKAELAAEQKTYEAALEAAKANHQTAQQIEDLRQAHLTNRAAISAQGSPKPRKSAASDTATKTDSIAGFLNSQGGDLARQQFELSFLRQYGEAALSSKTALVEFEIEQGKLSDATLRHAGITGQAAQAYQDMARAQAASQDANAAALQAEKDNARLLGNSAEQVQKAQELQQLKARELQMVGMSAEAQARANIELKYTLQLERDIKALKDTPSRADQEAKLRADNAKARAAEIAAADAGVAINAAQKAVDESKRRSESLTQTLSDALMRGFESGKGFAVNFGDTVKNIFKTMILEPRIKASVQPLADALNRIVDGFAKGIADALAQSNSGGGSWLSNIGSWLFSANGNAFGAQGLSAVTNAAQAGVQAFAKGDSFTNTVVSQPTAFQFGSGKLGVMGEAGPEAVMPLTRIGGQLGVRAEIANITGAASQRAAANDSTGLSAVQAGWQALAAGLTGVAAALTLGLGNVSQAYAGVTAENPGLRTEDLGLRVNPSPLPPQSSVLSPQSSAPSPQSSFLSFAGAAMAGPLPLPALSGRPPQAAPISITINNTAPNNRVTQKQTTGNNGQMNLTILVEQVEAGLSRNVADGRGTLATTMERTYALNRSAGAMR